MAGIQDTVNNTAEQVLPFRFWWGFAFCAAVMGLIVALGPYSDSSMFVPDHGSFWYYWQLKEPTVVTRLSAWLPYTAHIVSIWFLIYQAKHAQPRYILGLHRFNLWALGVNAFFVLLHIAQTKYFYDGLAQDVHETTSMGSVIIMLFLILIMENNRRGMFFGKKLGFMTGVGDAVKRYHGYYIAWAIIYTFWYHPVETTSGHLAGFAYMFLLLLQSSLFFTRYHVNRTWTMFLEALFVIHGAAVAAFILNPGQHQFWSQFLFGGMAIFLITQMHGLGLSTRGKLWVAAPLVAIMLVFYFNNPDLLPWLATLPATMYLGSVLLFGILWLLGRVGHLLPRSADAEMADPVQSSGAS
ncbi:MAG: hypothetical protein V2J12_08510 [Gammaproteobacteria bacterium]|jgi:hypothetical protein|nr:hypothetical protein [Gammaproteobacteria bacterium]